MTRAPRIVGIVAGLLLLVVMSVAIAMGASAQGRRDRIALEQTAAARMRAEIRVATLLRIAQTDQATIATLQARIALLETPTPPPRPRPERHGPVPIFGRW